MEKIQSYHHGNLRNELIEKAIAIVNSEGEQALSIRKVAGACGVTYAAPYAHFKNKEDLLTAIQAHITEQFSTLLENTLFEYKESKELLLYLGNTYVNFFLDNPNYFSFLYSQSHYPIVLSPKNGEALFKPYEIFKRALSDYLDKTNCPKEKYNDIALALLSQVHGIAGLATMKNIQYNENWKDKVLDILRTSTCSYLEGAK